MITCPKCGASNPDGFRNCRECYHPFGLERALGEVGATPLDEAGEGASETAGPPPPGSRSPVPRPSSPRTVAGKPPLALLAVLAVALVMAIFAAAWLLTRRDGGAPQRHAVEAFDNMAGLAGWKARVRVDWQGIPLDEPSLLLGEGWEGELAYQAPDRISLVARPSRGEGSYEMRIVCGTLYLRDGAARVWIDLGEAQASQRGMNPVWNDVFIEGLSFSEEGVDHVNHRTCMVLAFDGEVAAEEGPLGMGFEATFRYAGRMYVESESHLLVAMDYVVELPGVGSSHYRYDFDFKGPATPVEAPPGAVTGAGGG